ncbi:hypothetical protein Taro_041850 [Colocasia esculenta]|uniref:BAG domain-containing protein n=1 Tax=Colocasia esculenta TaxID=4460 RepID=A0A843WUT3_COLES|nr:hypothetical protein [Colocasia esculenta]
MEEEVRVVGAEDRVNGKPQGDGTMDMNVVMEVEDRSTSKNEGGEKNQNKLDAHSTVNHTQTGNDLVPGTGKGEDVSKEVGDRKCGQLKVNEEVILGHSGNEIDDCKKNIEESDGKKMEADIGRKCKLSETNAVLHIQARYRGYQVRRWEPLKKLKQIAKIRDQVSSIKQKIHSLEISSEGELEKQKLFIGEIIMNLLLQLDAIQGLHPSVREIRKSVARDLVSLQEKLEILSNKVVGGLMHTDAGGASTVRDSKNALEDVCCNNTSDLKESFPQEEYEQPPCEVNLDYSAADKNGGAIEMFVEDFVGHNSSTGNKELLIETRDEQTPNPETELIGRSMFENKEPCCSETEEYTKSPAPEVGIDSDATNVSKQQQLQKGVKDEAEEDFGKDDGKADAELAEFCEMQAEEEKQPADNMQPFSVISPVMLEEGENALSREEVVPVVEDLTNIQEHKPVSSSESSESSWHFENSASGNEALIMLGETRQGEYLVLDDSLENYCVEVGDAVSCVLPCPEPSIQEVLGVEANGSVTVSRGTYELENLSGHEHVNPEIAVKDGAAEYPEVKILDAPVPAYPDVIEKDSCGENSVVDILGSPALTYLEIADKEGDAVNPNVEIMDTPVPAQPEVADGEGNVEHLIDAPVPASGPGMDLAKDDNIHEMPGLPVEEIPTPAVEDHDGDNTDVAILDSPAPRHPGVAHKEGDAVHPKMEIMDVSVPAQLEVADLEGDAEPPNAQVIDAPMPASSAVVDLAEDDSNREMPAWPIEEAAPEEEGNERKSELLDMKDLNMLQVGSTDGECSTEPTAPTRVSVDFQVPATEQTSMVGTEHERKLMEENEKLRGMLEKLLEAGNKQLEMISSLSGRVKGLEKKVAHSRKLKIKRRRASKSSPCDNIAPDAAVESAA